MKTRICLPTHVNYNIFNNVIGSGFGIQDFGLKVYNQLSTIVFSSSAEPVTIIWGIKRFLSTEFERTVIGRNEGGLYCHPSLVFLSD